MSIPPISIGLLVHVAIHKYLVFWLVICVASRSLNINNKEGRAAFILNLFDLYTFNLASFGKFSQVGHLLEQVSINFPIFIKKWCKTFNLYKLYQN